MILVVGRLLLPGVVRDQLNARLDHMGPYHGHVDTVRLHLWRGAYSLHGMTIVKVGKAVPVPLFKGDVVEIEMSWSGLLHGGVVGRAAFDNPEINFVDNTGKGGSQTGEGHDWRAQLEALLPIKLDEVVVRNGVVTFRNFSSNPPVDLRITKLDATVKNLTNVAGKDGGRVADFTGKASVLGEAPLEMKGRFDPFGRPDTFELSLSIQQIDLTRINSLARAYAGVDIASGTGTFALELQANKGHVEGYAKPLFTDLKIFSWKQDVAPGNKNVVQLTYEALAGAVTELFTNQRNDQFGTRVPISGELGETQVGLVGAVYGIVRNAFVEAYKPGFDKLPPRPAKDEKK